MIFLILKLRLELVFDWIFIILIDTCRISTVFVRFSSRLVSVPLALNSSPVSNH